ncbi:isochorismatase family cysteine hydrolase [Streptomyces sp. NPDC005731]|uniref:cysteine hydrolase family protein n=1 Tax=unclassified Streptomyces TaxID=2593676 RepID=UPI0033F60792
MRRCQAESARSLRRRSVPRVELGPGVQLVRTCLSSRAAPPAARPERGNDERPGERLPSGRNRTAGHRPVQRLPVRGREAVALRRQVFAAGSWGAEWHPDFVPREGELVMRQHWASSGFANTDLDMLLKQHRVQKIVLIGMKANTCVDTTARFGQELGYHVTLIRDAIGAFNWDEMRATFDINAPAYAHAVLTTDEFLTMLGKRTHEMTP